MTDDEAQYWAELITSTPSAVYPCWLLAEARYWAEACERAFSDTGYAEILFPHSFPWEVETP